MHINPKLEDVDDSLYRVAVRALVVQNDKILVVKEVDSKQWSIPGGGVDYGEDLKTGLLREIEEELGIAAESVSSDFQIVHYDIGKIVNGVPRMNIFFTVSVPEDHIQTTSHVEKWGWFTQDEFMKLDTNPSHDKRELIKVIFSQQMSIN